MAPMAATTVMSSMASVLASEPFNAEEHAARHHQAGEQCGPL